MTFFLSLLQTWRDWKLNLRKRLGKHKRHAYGTGGGPPQDLNLTKSERDLCDFMGPEDLGLSGIPEGEAVNDNIPSSSFFSVRLFYFFMHTHCTLVT